MGTVPIHGGSQLRHVQLARLALATLTAGLLAGALIAPAAALADHGLTTVADGAIDTGKETKHHDAQQHGEDQGHLPPISNNVAEIGHIDLFAPGDEAGRIGDVSAKGNYAFLTHYREPTCERGGGREQRAGREHADRQRTARDTAEW